MVVTSFEVLDKPGRALYFQKTFSLAEISMEVVFGMPFLILNNANVKFADKELTWKSYTVKENPPTTRRVEIIDKEECAKETLDENVEVFVYHGASLISITIHLSREAQIALLLVEEVTVSNEYLDYPYVFLKESAEVILERTEIKNQAIKLEKDKQPLYRPIYSLRQVELENLKTYRKTNLANGFIKP